MKVIPVILIFLQAFSTHGQTSFQKSFGGTNSETARSAMQTTDRGFIVGGITNSSSITSLDFYLLKTDSLGSLVWAKSYGDTLVNQAYAVQQTYDGGYILAGYSEVIAGAPRTCLIKTDAAGDTSWTREYGNAFCEGYAAEQADDDGYIITGVTTAGNYLDVQLLKTDVNGNVMWNKSIGGADHDYGYSVHQTFDHGYIIGGYSESFGGGDADFYLVKTDGAGNVQWSKTYGGPMTDMGACVLQTAEGGYIFCGKSQSFGAGNYDVYVIRTNGSGDTLWTKTYGGPGYDAANFISQTDDGGYVITGSTQSFGAGDRDIYLIKIDSAGVMAWSQAFGDVNYDDGFSVHENADLSFLISGMTYSPVTNQNYYLIKTDNNGFSGCHESSAATAESRIPSQVMNPATQNTSADTTALAVPFTVETLGAETTFCFTATPEYSWASGGFTVSPNPAGAQLKFSTSIFPVNAISIFNLLGEKVLAVQLRTPNSTLPMILDVSYLPAGIYFLQALTDEGIAAEKFVKE